MAVVGLKENSNVYGYIDGDPDIGSVSPLHYNVMHKARGHLLLDWICSRCLPVQCDDKCVL